ncbi:MAG: acyltransferase family protein [Egibacteraceae bacterium]
MRGEAATPPERDRMIDALRAGSIGCVILGHWLVTALVVDRSGVRITSPLTAMPWLAGVTWVLQVLALFFFVGGYVNSRSLASARAAGRGYQAWLAGRARRLGRPIVVLLAVWAAAAGVAVAVGVPVMILRTLGLLVVQPLWFIVVYLLVTALTPAAVAAYQRLGLWAALMSGLVVGVVDLAQLGPSAPRAGGLRWATVIFAWLVAYLLGIAWADGGLRSRRAALLLVAGGGVLAAVLVWRGGYPASMVGVTGAVRSNLNPPSLLVPAVTCVQIGVVLLVRDRLARHLRRPRVWAVTALMNRSAMTLFLWHQTALVLVTLALAPRSLTPWGAIPGLHTVPSATTWVGARLGWLPVFAGMLSILWASFRRFEQGLISAGRRARRAPTA